MGATVRTVDMSNVKESSGFNQSRIPAGDYAAIITKVDDAVTKESKKDAYQFAIKIKDKPSSVFRYYCVLDDKQLWKLRNLFIAAGKTVPKKKMKIDPNTIVGKLIGVTIEDAEDYKDREQSEISGVFPASELSDSVNVSSSDDDDDDEPADEDLDIDVDEPDTEDEEDGAEESEDPYADLDRSELKARIKAIQPDFKVLKSHTDDDLRAALAKIDVPPTDQDEDDDEEAPAPKKKSKAKATEVSDDDLDDLDVDDL